MKMVRDAIGCDVFVCTDKEEIDDPFPGTLHVEYTDITEDELGFFIRTREHDLSVYVTFELWETLYKMVIREKERLERTIQYTTSNTS